MTSCKQLAALMLALPLVSACIDNASDPDAGNTFNRSQVSGVAVDGYIAGARVYADINGDGRRNSYEPQAWTDEYGYFSYRPAFINSFGESVAAKDYCADEATQRFCLRVADTMGEVRIRVQGGYDLSTGQPFQGSLNGLFTVTASDDRNVRAVTPFSSTSLLPATVEGDFWGRTGLSDTDGEKAVQAFQKHQSLVAIARNLRDALDDEDLTIAQLMAAVQSELQVALDGQDWWTLDSEALQSAILAAGSRFGEGDDLAAGVAAAVAELLAIRAAVTDAMQSAELSTSSADELVGLTRALKAFLRLEYARDAGGTARDDEPLAWAWGRVADAGECAGDNRSHRLRVELMAQEMLKAELDRDYCSTLGSGSFPNLNGQMATFDDGEGTSMDVAFNDDGTLTIKASGLLDDFDDDAEFDGFWSQPSEDQVIITMTAFDGSFTETGSLTYLNEPDLEAGEKFEFSFRYLDEESIFSLDSDPFIN